MKKRLIAGALALSMVLAGTGYAYWTDSLNITTTASTGDLDVTFADLGLYAQFPSDTPSNGFGKTWAIIDGFTENNGFVQDGYFARQIGRAHV